MMTDREAHEYAQQIDRAIALDGKRVEARPNGPMGVTVYGTANGWDHDRSAPVVYVDLPDGTQAECWVFDVTEAEREPGELSAWERSTRATAEIMAGKGCDPKGWPLLSDANEVRMDR